MTENQRTLRDIQWKIFGKGADAALGTAARLGLAAEIRLRPKGS